jgi:hypothetical protein
MATPHNDWHLDKKVPIALIFALMVQMFAFGAWLSSLNTTVFQTEQRLVRLEANDQRQTDLFGMISDRLARIEERIISVQHDQTRGVRR